MSFNRRGPDRRPDRPDRDRPDRPPQRRGDWQPRERAGGDRPFTPRDRPQGNRPYQPRGEERPFTPRPRFDRPPDEGGMSIRLDPRRVNALKHLAGEAGLRPGDLVRRWVEERLDAERGATPAEGGGESIATRLEALVARVAALEAAAGGAPAAATATASAEPSEPAASAGGQPRKPKKRPKRIASAAPSAERIALHDEMIAVIRERGPLPAAELAAAVAERGRYTPPRSGKAIDAAMISQRVSNPAYRSRFLRAEGRIGLADEA